MPIDWYRDLVLIIFGSVSSLVMIYFAIELYRFSRKVGPILNSIEHTAKVLEEVSVQIVNPMVQIMAIIQLISRGIGAVSNLFKKGEEHGK